MMLSVALVVTSSSAFAAANVTVIAESDTVLVMQFEDAPGTKLMVTFTRASVNDLWEANVAGGEPGVIFGKNATKYAGASSLRSSGVSAKQAVQTFDSSIAARPFDDVTIFRLYGGDAAVALWQNKSITEIWFVGSLVEELLIPPGPANTCELSLNACCHTKSVGEPANEYPWPDTSACVAVISSCGFDQGAEACDCLSAACAFCWDDTPDPLCEDIPGLEGKTSDACARHTNGCPGGLPPIPDPADAATNLLIQILDRAQVVRDTKTP